MTPSLRALARPRSVPAARPSRVRRTLVLVALGALVALPAGPASAHVRVVPESTAAGGWSALTFRVPTESDTASTVALSVELPSDVPFLSVSTRPVPGWTATLERAPLPEPVDFYGTTLTEAPARVTWTVDDAQSAVAPGQFQEFEISVGPLPEDAGTVVVLPAEQTYSDGTVVRWADVATGDGEPEHPAPVLVVTEAEAEDEAGAAAPVAAPAEPERPSASGTVAATSRPDGLARALGGAGLLLGAAAVVIALVGRRSTTEGRK